MGYREIGKDRRDHQEDVQNNADKKHQFEFYGDTDQCIDLKDLQ